MGYRRQKHAEYERVPPACILPTLLLQRTVIAAESKVSEEDTPSFYTVLSITLSYTLKTIMASRLRTPTLGLAALSMCLCLGIIGTAGRSIHVFNHQQSTNVWLLPIWPNHFDIRELQTLIGTAAAIFLLNAILAVALVVPSVRVEASTTEAAFPN